MSDYLARLASRLAAPEDLVQPRLAGRFEPWPEMTQTWPGFADPGFADPGVADPGFANIQVKAADTANNRATVRRAPTAAPPLSAAKPSENPAAPAIAPVSAPSAATLSTDDRFNAMRPGAPDPSPQARQERSNPPGESLVAPAHESAPEAAIPEAPPPSSPSSQPLLRARQHASAPVATSRQPDMVALSPPPAPHRPRPDAMAAPLPRHAEGDPGTAAMIAPPVANEAMPPAAQKAANARLGEGDIAQPAGMAALGIAGTTKLPSADAAPPVLINSRHRLPDHEPTAPRRQGAASTSQPELRAG